MSKCIHPVIEPIAGKCLECGSPVTSAARQRQYEAIKKLDEKEGDEDWQPCKVCNTIETSTLDQICGACK